MTFGHKGNLLGGADRNDLTATVTALGTKVNDMVKGNMGEKFRYFIPFVARDLAEGKMTI